MIILISIKRYPPDKNDRHSKIRNDGSYFICQDGEFKPKQDDCIVLSFGVHLDDRFDEFVNQELKCIVHSFDPFTEPDRYLIDIHSHKSLEPSYHLLS